MFSVVIAVSPPAAYLIVIVLKNDIMTKYILILLMIFSTSVLADDKVQPNEVVPREVSDLKRINSNSAL